MTRSSCSDWRHIHECGCSIETLMPADIYQPTSISGFEKISHFSSVYFTVQEFCITMLVVDEPSVVMIFCCRRCINWAAMVKRSRCWLWERLLCPDLTRAISASLLMLPWTQTMATSMCLMATAIPGSSNSHQRANICPTGEQVHILTLRCCCCCCCVHDPWESLRSPFQGNIKESIKHNMCSLCNTKWWY